MAPIPRPTARPALAVAPAVSAAAGRDGAENPYRVSNATLGDFQYMPSRPVVQLAVPGSAGTIAEADETTLRERAPTSGSDGATTPLVQLVFDPPSVPQAPETTSVLAEGEMRAASSGQGGSTAKDAETQLKGLLRRTLGLPYRSDGASPQDGFSTGGLVQWLYKQIGVVDVPRLPEDQFMLAGRKIDMADWEPQTGDLVFFNVGSAMIVGVVSDSERQSFVTVAPGKGGVITADLEDAFFKRRLAGVRRLLPDS